MASGEKTDRWELAGRVALGASRGQGVKGGVKGTDVKGTDGT